MLPLLLPAATRELDRICEDDYGLSPLVLMENAARSAVDILQTLLPAGKPRVLIACGNGNNGGDGYAMARMLASNCSVTVLGAGPCQGQSAAAASNAAAAVGLVSVLPWAEAPRLCAMPWDVVIDAVVGVGGSSNLRVEAAMLCAMLDSIQALKVAIDVPTGLDASTGVAHADAFVAHHTITMAAPKVGMYVIDGPSHCGNIHVASIGAPPGAMRTIRPAAYVLQQADVAQLLPPRKASATKFSAGRVLVIGGCRSMPGAPSLAAHAAVVAGAGLVELVSTMIHPATPREVMPTVVAATTSGTISPDALPILLERARRASAIVVGPGLGRNSETLDAIGQLLRDIDPAIPVVLDADGLAAFPIDAPYRTNMVLTPHIGEFAGMTGRDVGEIEVRPLEIAREVAQATGCTVHLKHSPSITTNGLDTFLSVRAVPAMASGGMGDVLSGIIGAMIAQGVHNQKDGLVGAAALAAYLHASAGERASQRVTGPAVTASMVIDELPYVF
jgi:hydroxyethylthiazole kinase-like uncharacterized protein yjeF